MTIRLIQTNDNRTEIERYFDEQAKQIRALFGDQMTGFVIVAWPDDKKEAAVAYHAGKIDPDFLGEYIYGTLQDHQIEIELE